eukprot:6210481-Pleurochrysis_carterae.AAC.6
MALHRQVRPQTHQIKRYCAAAGKQRRQGTDAEEVQGRKSRRTKTVADAPLHWEEGSRRRRKTAQRRVWRHLPPQRKGEKVRKRLLTLKCWGLAAAKDGAAAEAPE